MSALDERRKKLLHRARYRGFREADLLIGRFAAAALPLMSDSEIEAFETLLSCNDHDLYSCIVEGTPPPAGADPALIARMRAFNIASGVRGPFEA